MVVNEPGVRMPTMRSPGTAPPSGAKLTGRSPLMPRIGIAGPTAAMPGTLNFTEVSFFKPNQPLSDLGFTAMAVKPKSESGWFGLKKLTSVKFKVPGIAAVGPAIPIRGSNGDLPVSFAPDGGAVPGDRIVGILTPGEGITIYPIQSAALSKFEDKPERWLDLRWDAEERASQRRSSQR